MNRRTHRNVQETCSTRNFFDDEFWRRISRWIVERTEMSRKRVALWTFSTMNFDVERTEMFMKTCSTPQVFRRCILTSNLPIVCSTNCSQQQFRTCGREVIRVHNQVHQFARRHVGNSLSTEQNSFHMDIRFDCDSSVERRRNVPSLIYILS